MKKLLALVLALVMVMGLSVVSTSAAFADAASIEHTEAVEVLNSLGVIGGKENNNFDPTGNVKRSEMAKMVALLMLGDVDDTAFKGAPTDLTDIDGHWAEGWIKYCVSQGIVGGRGNGKFDPDANVTAAEAAKMLLVAIGYNATVQGYTGSQWQVNVTRDAQVSGFYKLLSGLGANKALTRDEAAQMIYNAGDCRLTTHTESLNSSGERITVYTAKDATAAGDPLFESAYKLETKDNANQYVTKIELQDSGTHKGEYEITVAAATTGPFYTKTDYSALLGQKVTVRFSDDNGNGNYNYPKDELVGIYAVNQDNVAGPFVPALTSRDSDAKIKVDGTKYSLNKDGVTVYTVEVDGTISADTATLAAGVADKATAFAGIFATAKASYYSSFTLIDNDGDSTYDAAVIYQANPAKVSYVDSSKVIAGSKTYKFADYVIYDGVAKDDYVGIQWSIKDGTAVLTKLDTVSGKVTQIDGSDAIANKVTIGGTVVADAKASAKISTVDNEYNYWALNGWVYDSKLTSNTDMGNLVLVAGVTSSTFKQVSVYYLDGTRKVLTVDDDASGGQTYTQIRAAVNLSGGETPGATDRPMFYKVSETSKGYKFTTLTATPYTDVTYDAAGVLPSDQANATYSAAGAIVSFYDGANNEGIADDAVIFVYNPYDWSVKVITGDKLKHTPITVDAATGNNAILNADAQILYKAVNGLNKVTVASVIYNKGVAGWAGWNATSTSNHYALVTSDAVTITDGHYQYTIWDGEQNLTVKDKTNNATKFSVVAYSGIDSDGYLKDVVYAPIVRNNLSAVAGMVTTDGHATTRPGALAGFELNSDKTYDLYFGDTSATGKFVTDSKTVFMTINSGADSANDIGISNSATVVKADKSSSQLIENAIVMAEQDGTARVVIFDTTNTLATDAASYTTPTMATNNLKITLNGNAVTTTTKLKAGDVLEIKNESTTTNYTFGATTNCVVAGTTTALEAYTGAGGAAGRIDAGRSVTVVVKSNATTGVAAVTLTNA